MKVSAREVAEAALLPKILLSIVHDCEFKDAALKEKMFDLLVDEVAEYEALVRTSQQKTNIYMAVQEPAIFEYMKMFADKSKDDRINTVKILAATFGLIQHTGIPITERLQEVVETLSGEMLKHHEELWGKVNKSAEKSAKQVLEAMNKRGLFQ